jgi:hypothetical protein
MVMATKSKALIGIAGVHFVLSEMARKGFIALPTVRNTAGFDIIATNNKGDQHVNIQVKSSLEKRHSWLLGGEVPEYMRAEKAFYAFVRDDGDGRFEAFVVGGREVHAHNQAHMRKPRRKGSNPFHTWHLPKDNVNQYKNRWDKLGLE